VQGLSCLVCVSWQKARAKAHFQMGYLSFSLDNTVRVPGEYPDWKSILHGRMFIV